MIFWGGEGGNKASFLKSSVYGLCSLTPDPQGMLSTLMIVMKTTEDPYNFIYTFSYHISHELIIEALGTAHDV